MTTSATASAVSRAEISAFLTASFPQSKCTVDEVGHGTAVIRHLITEAELRPGGTVAGPVLMFVADVGLYVAIFGAMGVVPLAVTTSLNINFLRKPSADASIIGVCKLLKIGKSLCVGEVTLYSEGNPDPVAHATGTYSIPKKK